MPADSTAHRESQGVSIPERMLAEDGGSLFRDLLGKIKEVKEGLV